MEPTPGPWWVMNDGPVGDRKPWTAYMEAAPGLTIGSPHNTEPICRVSGYLQPLDANARLIAHAPAMREALRKIANYWNGHVTDGAMHDACERNREVAYAVLRQIEQP